MPTYDLRCEDCGERFERFLARLIRDEDKRCPRCGSTRVKVGVGGGFIASSCAGSRGSRGGFT